MALNSIQAQHAWLVVAGNVSIPNFPIVAPYIAINTLPVGLILAEEFATASSVILSGIFEINPSFKSPVLSQGIFWSSLICSQNDTN